MTVGERIRYRREELGLSQEELGNLVGYKGSAKTRISRYETAGNEISMKQLNRIAPALKVSVAYLMGWYDDEEDNNPIDTSTYSDLSPNEQLIIDRYRGLPDDRKTVLLGYILAYTE